ncbi:MAG: class II aldolase/adducin family protein [Hadesarchaea archaeon]|nr:MAG: class II aldolase/adducin family protein [Hadesarchaea archaeon]
MELEELKRKLVETGRRLVERGLVAGSAGNLSLRVPGKELVLISPSRVPYESLRPEEVSVVNLRGELLEGRTPSVETRMHLAVYGARPEVGAVIHTHPVCASALAAVGLGIPPFLEEVVVLFGGEVEVAEYAPPGSEELARNALRALGRKNAVLLSNHGALCCGRDLDHALEVSETLERVSRSYVLSLLLGGPRYLPEEAVKLQRRLFEALG